MRWIYSRWDGTRVTEGVDPDELMEALSDDLMADRDLGAALHRIVRSGLPRDGEERIPGMQTLLRQLRGRRQAELQRYDLDSILQDIRDRVADVVETECAGIDTRSQEASGDAALAEILRAIAERKRSFLRNLPDDPGSAVTALMDYEFLDEEAREKFRALTEMLERHVLQRHFQRMESLLGGLVGDELESVKAMLHDLDTLLQEHLAGRDGDGRFDDFMQRHAQHFDGASSVEDLIAQMHDQASHTEALMESMSPEMRGRLDEMMVQVLKDHTLRDELTHVYETLESLAPHHRPHRDYPFSGEQSLTLEEALRLMRRMHDLDELERAMLRAQELGGAENLDEEQVLRALGPAALEAVEQLKSMEDVLLRAGYVDRDGDAVHLTARGIRRIGQTALHDIFSHLKRDAFGEHALPVRGPGGDRSDETKEYEFGDPFMPDLHATLMNAVERVGSGTPLHLVVEDFEMYATEERTQAATVLMLDMSRSMPLRGCFAAAKRVVLALNSLIRLHYPRDHLYIVGFSDYARQLRPESLHGLSWGDYVYGTNMQHGLMLARRLLARHTNGTKQVILITDGEPTAHFEGGRVHFAYPPTFRTFQETLREVKRCTNEGIVINTFMLERSHYLADFVTQMTRINRGRAFFATPECLGDYILVDYVNSHRKIARTR